MQHFANREARYRVPQVRRQVGQGRQYEAALGDAWVGNFECRTVDYRISIQEDVDIDGARALRKRSYAPQFTLDPADEQ